MTKPMKKSYRLSEETVRQIEVLARKWAGVTRPSEADVVAECVRRCHEAEARKKGKGGDN